MIMISIPLIECLGEVNASSFRPCSGVEKKRKGGVSK